MKNNDRLERIIKLLFRGFMPMLMLVAGVILMTSEISGWNLIIGTPITVLGTIFLIFTYDEVIAKKVTPLSQELTRCAICAKLTPRVAGVDPKDTICPRCKQKVGRQLAKEKQGKK